MLINSKSWLFTTFLPPVLKRQDKKIYFTQLPLHVIEIVKEKEPKKKKYSYMSEE